MNWQLPIAVLFVAWAAFILARRTVRLWTGRGKSAGSCASGGCASGGCGPGTASHADERTLIPVEGLTRNWVRSSEREHGENHSQSR